MTRSGSVLVLASMVAAAACAGPRSGGGDAQAPRPNAAIEGLEARRCSYVAPRSELPPFEELARAGTRGNVALWGRDMGPEDTVQLSIRYGEDGRLVWARAITSTLAAERTSALERLVLGALPDTGPYDWGMRVFVVGGDVTRVEPSVICEPERGALTSLVGLPYTPSGRAAFEQSRGFRFPVQVALDDRGRIMEVRLGRRTGHVEVDQFLVDYAQNSRFEPRLHDGIGIPSQFEFYIAIRRRF